MSNGVDENLILKEEKEYRRFIFLDYFGPLVEKTCLRIIRVGTFLILFTPLVILPKLYFPFVGPKTIYFWALVEIIFATYIFLAISFPKYRPKFNILLIAVTLFIVISILAAIFGADFSSSFWSKYERMTGLLMFFHLFAFFLVISSVFQKKDWSRIFGVSVMVAVLISILTLLPKIGIDPFEKINLTTHGGATLGNSSFLATYLLFNVFLALYLFLTSSKRRLEIFSGAGFVLIALTLFLSGGRAAALSFFGGMILLFFLKLIFWEKGRLRLVGIFLFIFLLLGGIGGIFLATQPDNIIHKAVIQQTSSSTIESRLLVWRIGFLGWQERPWLGWGQENFNLIFTKHFDSRIFLSEIYGADLRYDQAHNIVVDTLATTGILGFLSYLGIFCSVFYVLRKKYLSHKIELLTAGVFAVILISYFIQNLTVFDMPSSLIMLFLVLGFVGSIASQKKSSLINLNRKPISLNPWLAFIILIFFTSSFFYFVIQPFRTDYYLIKAFQTRDFPERIYLYRKTLEASPLGKYQIRENIASTGVLKLSKKEIAEKVPDEIEKQELDFVSRELEKSIQESPLLASSYFTLGEVYNIYGRLIPSTFTRAEEVLEKAIEISPTHQRGYWDLAQTKLFLGKVDEAVSLAEKAVELEPRVKKSHLLLIQVAKRTGNGELVIKKVQEAFEINPSWRPELRALLEQ